MSDSPLEELEHHEHAEHAEHAAHAGDPLISQVTFTIAVLAVVAAIAASLETTESDKAISAKNDAVLAQNQATDAWGEYQSDSIKKNLYLVAADGAGPKAAAYAKKAADEGVKADATKPKALKFEERRKAATEAAEGHEVRHGHLTIASTLLHMAIAIATLAIILHRRWPWWTSLGLAAAGAALGVWAYL
jgi:hypothetical protein